MQPRKKPFTLLLTFTRKAEEDFAVPFGNSRTGAAWAVVQLVSEDVG